MKRFSTSNETHFSGRQCLVPPERITRGISMLPSATCLQLTPREEHGTQTWQPNQCVPQSISDLSPTEPHRSYRSISDVTSVGRDHVQLVFVDGDGERERHGGGDDAEAVASAAPHAELLQGEPRVLRPRGARRVVPPCKHRSRGRSRGAGGGCTVQSCQPGKQ